MVTTFWNGGPAVERYGGGRVLRVPDTSAFLGKWASVGDSHYWSWGFGVARVLKEMDRPDIVHAISPLITTSTLTKAGLPVVTTHHHHERLWRWRELLYRPLHSLLEFRAYLSSTLVNVPSDASRRIVERYGLSRSRIRVTPWGVDPKRFKPTQSDDLPGNRLLYVGPHEPRKGLEYLLKAVALLRREGVVVHLRTVGKGSQVPHLERLARELGISDAIEFLGYVEDPDDVKLPRLYSQADVFVLPSMREGFGLVLAEAMASGLPVVASDISAIPEVVGDAGILVPPGNVEALARVLWMLTEDSTKRRELGKKARARVEATFTWDKVIPRIMAVYEEAIEMMGRTG